MTSSVHRGSSVDGARCRPGVLKHLLTAAGVLEARVHGVAAARSRSVAAHLERCGVDAGRTVVRRPISLAASSRTAADRRRVAAVDSGRQRVKSVRRRSVDAGIESLRVHSMMTPLTMYRQQYIHLAPPKYPSITIKPAVSRVYTRIQYRIQVSRTSNLYPDTSGYNLYPGNMYPGVHAALHAPLLTHSNTFSLFSMLTNTTTDCMVYQLPNNKLPR